jgi:two-component system alkaline phosphatase synthesis response regulator PhoP/two-component system response regulator VicR
MEVLEAVAKELPELIVLDWMMPQLSGIETMKRLRANPATASIPIIMLTAKANDEDVFKGWSGGCDCYLTKPFNPMELITFANRILSPIEDEDDQESYIL